MKVPDLPPLLLVLGVHESLGVVAGVLSGYLAHCSDSRPHSWVLLCEATSNRTKHVNVRESYSSSSPAYKEAQSYHSFALAAVTR